MKSLKLHLPLLLGITFLVASCQPVTGFFSVTGEPISLFNRKGQEVQLTYEGSYPMTIYIHQRQGKVTVETRIGGKKQLFDFSNAFTASPYEEFDFFVDRYGSGQPYDLAWSTDVKEEQVSTSVQNRSCELGTTTVCNWEYDAYGEMVHRCRLVNVYGQRKVRITTYASTEFIQGHLLEHGADLEVARFQLTRSSTNRQELEPLSACQL